MSIISLKNLTKRFGPVTAIDNLSLEIEAGAICGILGPNGAGKSTTIRILATLTKPSSGHVFIGGHDVMAYPIEAKKLIGVVHQTLNVDPELTSLEHLAVHGMLFGMKRDLVSKRSAMLLDFVGLSEQKNMPAGKFSGGMKRRLTIARALVHDPKVIIMDEPTVGLDAHARRKLWALMRDLKTKGHTILLTTHYIDEAQSLADRIVIIDKGKVIADGAPQMLIGSVGAIAADITHSGENETHFFETKQDAAAFLGKEQCSGTVREANLEDVFIKLTGRKVD
jgi:ABC-2 type transport system ATP-binding protein